MGRKRKYFTIEEKLAAKHKRQMKHYWKNKMRLRKEALARYYARKDKRDL
jgi:hypothetical protein